MKKYMIFNQVRYNNEHTEIIKKCRKIRIKLNKTQIN